MSLVDSDSHSDATHPDLDYILVGGGLANGCIALALLHHQPKSRLLILEREPRLGGNHTWCFHENDLDPDAQAYLNPAIAHRWSDYEVRFPNRSQRVHSNYSCITSEHFHRALSARIEAAPHASLRTDTEVVSVEAQRVKLADGTELSATLVIDGRGPSPDHRPPGGFQKFVGLEVELEEDHGLSPPVLMDATVEQIDGFRFFYLLPFSERTLLVEDTYFSHDAQLDEATVEARVRDFISAQEYRIRRVIRRESGVLPMPSDGEPTPLDRPFRSGYAGGWFHPGTGYSVPVAVRVAGAVSQAEVTAFPGEGLRALAKRHEQQVRYAYWLNRLLFGCFDSADMWNVFERFYKLPEALIRRFYALDMSAADRARILVGRPPRGIRLMATAKVLRGRP